MIEFFLLESFGRDILVRLLFEVLTEGISGRKGLPFQVVCRWRDRIFDVAAVELLIFRQNGLGMSDKVLELPFIVLLHPVVRSMS